MDRWGLVLVIALLLFSSVEAKLYIFNPFGGGGNRGAAAKTISDLSSFNGMQFSVLPYAGECCVIFTAMSDSTAVGLILSDGSSYSDGSYHEGKLSITVTNFSPLIVSLNPTELTLNESSGESFTVFLPHVLELAPLQSKTFFVDYFGSTYSQSYLTKKHLLREAGSPTQCSAGKLLDYYEWASPKLIQLNDTANAIEFDSQGNIYFIAEGTALKKCQKNFVNCQTVFGEEGVPGADNSHLNNATGLGIDKTNGTILIADNGNNRILRLNQSFSVIDSLSGVNAFDVETDSKGNVFFSDGSTLRKFDYWLSSEKESFQANATLNGIFVDSKDNVFTATSDGNKVTEFDNLLISKLNQFQENTDSNESFDPHSIAVDEKGRAFAAGKQKHKVIELNPSLDLINHEFNDLNEAPDLALNRKELLVIDSGNQEVVLIERFYGCCGDNANEFPLHRECFNGCVSDKTDEVCCTNLSDCVMNGKCYEDGSISDANSGLICATGQWAELDEVPLFCSNKGFDFLPNGENELIGNYDLNSIECCGDDFGENTGIPKYYVVGESPCNQPGGCEANGTENQLGFVEDENGKACCSNSSDCVFDGNCFDGSNGNYSVQGIDGLNQDSLSICIDGGWFDCDKPNLCEECDKFADLPGCEGNECFTSSGETVAFGEFSGFGSAGCCGDDAGEFFSFFNPSTGNGKGACNQEGGCEGTNQGDAACCDDVNACVLNGECFDELTVQAIDASSKGYAFCSKGMWTECDESIDACGNCETAVDFADCVGQECWVASGSSELEEFEGIGAEGCCGDDEGEYFRCDAGNPSSCGCCPEPNEEFVDGLCVPFDLSERDSVYREKCIKEQDQSFCEKISDEALKNSSLYSLAVMLQDQTVCSSISNDQQLMDYCNSMVLVFQEPSMPFCGNNRVDSSLMEECDGTAAFEEGSACPGICNTDCSCPHVTPYYITWKVDAARPKNSAYICDGYEWCAYLNLNQSIDKRIKTDYYEFSSLREGIKVNQNEPGCNSCTYTEAYNPCGDIYLGNHEYFTERLNLQFWPNISNPIWCFYPNNFDQYGGTNSPFLIEEGRSYKLRGARANGLNCPVSPCYSFNDPYFFNLKLYCFKDEDCPGLYCDYSTGKCTSEYSGRTCPWEQNADPLITNFCMVSSPFLDCNASNYLEIRFGVELGFIKVPAFPKQYYYFDDDLYACNGEEWLFVLSDTQHNCDRFSTQQERMDCLNELLFGPSAYLRKQCPTGSSEDPYMKNFCATTSFVEACNSSNYYQIRCGTELGYDDPNQWYYSPNSFHVCNGEHWLFVYNNGCDAGMDQAQRENTLFNLLHGGSMSGGGGLVKQVQQKTDKEIKRVIN